MWLQLATTIPPPIKFKTAFEELVNRHAFLNSGIQKIDSLLNLTLGDRLVVTGNRKYTQMLVTRLCVNALLFSSSQSSKKRMYKRKADIFTHLMSY
jgi:hypothetical protein